MNNEDSIDYIPYYLLPKLKCVDAPKDGNTKRRERIKRQLKKRMGMIDDKKIEVAGEVEHKDK